MNTNYTIMDNSPDIGDESDGKVEDVLNLLKEGERSINYGTHKNIVLVLGNTGSGKSTLSQFIAGNNNDLTSIELGKGRGEYIIVDANNKIGSSTINSKTVFPELLIDNETNTAYYDCPGFSDTRSTAHDITATYFTKKVIDNSESVKLLFTVNYPSVRQGVDRHDFMELLRHASVFIKDIDKFKDSIAFVVTKVDNTIVPIDDQYVLLSDSQVKDQIAEFLVEVNKTVAEDQHQLLDQLSEKAIFYGNVIKLVDILLTKEAGEYTKLGIFRRPNKAGKLSKIVLLRKGKKSLERMIQENIEYTARTEGDFDYTISERSKNDIRDMVEGINRSTSSYVSLVGEEIRQYFHSQEKKTDCVYKLKDIFESAYDGFSEIERAITESSKHEEIVKKIIQTVDDLNISISGYNLLEILNNEKCLRVLQLFSDGELLTNSLQWGLMLRHIVEDLHDSKNWYSFLVNLYETLSQYDVQKNVSGYNVAEFKDQLGMNHKIKVSETKLKRLIDAMQVDKKGYHIKGYDGIMNIKVDDLRLKRSNEILDVTLNHQVQISFPNAEKLEVKGDYIKLSAIHDVIATGCSGSRKHIEIFALNLIFIDRDLIAIGDKCQVSIVAPKWEIVGNRKIVLDGTSGNAYSEAKAESSSNPMRRGKDGKPGLPGGSAGSFFGIGGTFINGQNLTISVNGGNGGPGQAGGDGADGLDGEDPPEYGSWCLKCDFAGFYRDRSFHVESAYRECEGWSLFSSTCYEYLVYGRSGGDGSDGGDGGAGGKGGHKGGAIMIGLYEKSNILVNQIDGRDGYAGAGGFGGIGGSNGEYESIIHDVDYFSTSRFPSSDSGTSGHDGSAGNNYRELVDREAKVEMSNPSQTINSFKHHLRQNLVDDVRKHVFTRFLNDLDEDSNITSLYDTLALVDELIGLESQFYELKNEMSLLPSYQSLLHRISVYSRRPKVDEDSMQYKKVLSYLYSATLSKICALKENLENNFISDTRRYLELVKENIIELKEATNQVAIHDYNDGFRSAMNRRIEGARDWIATQVTPEIERITDQIDSQIDSLIIETMNLQPVVLANMAKQEKLKQNLLMRTILYGVEIVSKFLCLLGPEGAAVGEFIGGRAEIIKNFDSDEQSAGDANEIRELPEGMAAALSEVTERIKEAPRILIRQLDDVTQELNKLPKEQPTDDLREIDGKIVEMRARLVKEMNEGAYLELQYAHNVRTMRVELMVLLSKKMEELKAQEPSVDIILERKLQIINHVLKMLRIGDFGFDMYTRYVADHDKVDVISDAFEKAKSDIELLKKYEESIYDTIIPLCQILREDANKLEGQLANKSQIALDISKWQVQRSIRDLQFQLNQMTKGFRVHVYLDHSMKSLSETMTTLINLYDRMENFRDKATLAAYIADISSNGANRIMVDNKELTQAIARLDLITKSNLVLGQYERAMNAFKQLVFPFANRFLEEFTLPSNLKVDDSIQNLVDSAVSNVEGLESKLAESMVSIHPKYDEDVYMGAFNSKVVSMGPFYVWKNDSFNERISKLLKGEEVTLYADVLKGINENAIKFDFIGIHLKSINRTMQSQLDERLINFDVEMVHLGNSYYRCGNKFYVITSDELSIHYSFEKFDGNRARTNVVHDKIKDGDFVLSPYAMWTMRLISRNDAKFSELGDYIDQVDLELEGFGQYVARDASVCDSNLEDYYKVENTLSEVNDIAVYDDWQWHDLIDRETVLRISHSKLRYRRGAEDDSDERESDGNSSFVTSGGNSNAKASSINNMINWLSSRVVFPKFLNPIERINNWFAKENSQYIDYSQFDLNGTLALADFVIRKFTKVNSYPIGDKSRDLLEVQGEAMNIVAEFEVALEELSREKSVSSIGEIEFDPINLQKSLIKEIQNGSFSAIPKILHDSVMNYNRSLQKSEFSQCLKGKINKLWERQKYNVVENEQLLIDGMQGDQIQIGNENQFRPCSPAAFRVSDHPLIPRIALGECSGRNA